MRLDAKTYINKAQTIHASLDPEFEMRRAEEMNLSRYSEVQRTTRIINTSTIELFFRLKV